MSNATQTRPTTPAQALRFAIRTASARTTVGASTRRLSHLAQDRIAKVETISAELMSLLDGAS